MSALASRAFTGLGDGMDAVFLDELQDAEAATGSCEHGDRRFIPTSARNASGAFYFLKSEAQ
jgi:hypothetical protein